LSNTLQLKATKLLLLPIPTKSWENPSTLSLADPRLVHMEEMDILEDVEA
jgi:hypothetical protein